MSKEIYISTTPHETRLAIVEDEQLAEIYYERENEYTLAGSIYNGKVTRVLPGMQSSFVDIGLERDAFLYVTDFMEEQGDAADFETDNASRRQPREAAGEAPATRERADQGDRRPSRRHDRPGRRERPQTAADTSTTEAESTISFDEPIAPAPTEAVGGLDTEGEGLGSRRWRGRRGRRRGRGNHEEQPATPEAGAEPAQLTEEAGGFEETLSEGLYAGADESGTGEEHVEQPLAESRPEGRGRNEGSRRGRDRHGRKDRESRQPRPSATPMFDNSYAGYASEEYLPEVSGEPVLLPGESIRKYRDPDEVAAEDAEAKRNAPPVAEVLVVSAPTIEIVGWDGGAVLPGETLGRKRGNERRAGSQQRAAFVPDTPERPKQAVVTAPAEPEPPTMSAPLASPEAEVPSLDEPSQIIPDAKIAASAPSGQAVEEPAAEYEPEEGSAASVVDSGRRNLLRMERHPDTEDGPEQRASEADAELAGSAPDPTTYDLQGAAQTAGIDGGQDDGSDGSETYAHEVTEISASGDMVSHADVPEQETAAPQTQDEAGPEQQSGHDGHQLGVPQADLDLPLEAADEDGAGVHSYGEGDFYVEELDGDTDADDFDLPVALAQVEDGEVEYEEETLAESSDPGSVFHDMSQDMRDGAEDEDNGKSLGDAGGFTEEDFLVSAEPADEDAAFTGQANGTSAERLPRRERQAGGGRDRRGGRNSGDRGRGGRRQSMQTTDLPAINELLKPGQEILVQIAKEPIAKKGARITSHIALPGRFLVFMPTVNHTGVSRKISSDEERRRLKSILLSEKGDAQGGFIVRTAADGASEEELRNDLRFLIQMWTDIKMRSESSKSPALIYHDLNLVERILRDQVTDNFSAIWVDTEQEYERVLRFLQRFQPSLVRRVKLYTKETPLFEHFGVTAEIDKALKSKVWLKSGGSIVINQTEALVAIDINTGKYVGKTARLEDTILKTNLDAIPEIVRQIRLRDLGGIIVIDFIDMDERKNRAKVMQALEDAMHADRAPSKILPFNDFGLVIMTRKRVKQSLERTLCIPDPVTEGTGMIKSPVTIANEIYIEMRKMHRHLEKTDVLLRVHPEVVKTLKSNGGKRLQELEDMTRKTILVKSDPTLSPEAFDIH